MVRHLLLSPKATKDPQPQDQMTLVGATGVDPIAQVLGWVVKAGLVSAGHMVPAPRTCSERQRKSNMEPGTSLRQVMSPWYPMSFSFRRFLLRSGTFSYFSIL